MILHVPFTYFPDPAGGTEIYLASLVEGLGQAGVPVAVAAPSEAANAQAYRHANTPVYRYPGAPALTRPQVWARQDPTSVASFASLVRQLKPKCVHFHGVTAAISDRHAAFLAQSGIPWLLTYHTPTVSCLRGSMMRMGQFECDGEMIERRCAACSLHSLGLPNWLAKTVANLPKSLSQLGAQAPGAMATVLGSRLRTSLFQQSASLMLKGAERVIAVCDWVYKVVERNGVDASKIVLSRQGLSHDTPVRPRHARAAGRTQLIFLGRADPVKGTATLLRALKLKPELDLDLDLYLVVQDASAETHFTHLRAITDGDARVRWHINQPRASVLAQLPLASAVLIPSQWMETGPLTVLEAQAAGVPVLGSDLGGIAELVRDGVDGWLVPAENTDAWAQALERLVQDPDQLAQMRLRVPKPRLSAAVVGDHLELYASLGLLDARAQASAPF